MSALLCGLFADFETDPRCLARKRWPSFARDHVWKSMLRLGVDWINADNLKAASEL